MAQPGPHMALALFVALDGPEVLGPAVEDDLATNSDAERPGKNHPTLRHRV